MTHSKKSPSYFLEVFKIYNKPLRGLFYMPTRWAIVPLSLVESYIPKSGTVFDLGTGEGVMATFLALSSGRRKVIGIDLNTKKINLAKRLTSTIPNVSFEVKDATESLPKAAGFVLSDFLHHVPMAKHKLLFSNIYSSLSDRGVMVIKEVDTNDKLRSKISRLFDLIFYPNDKINFLSSDSLIKSLSKIGFKVTMTKVKKWFPGSTTLYVCTK